MTPRLLTLPEQLAILRAADAYARQAVVSANAKQRAKRLGNPVGKCDKPRAEARDRLVEVLKEL